MKKQELLKLKKLSVRVGHFIRYWGFRKIHGQIWTVIYLHKESLSGNEICELLNVSKALMSPALKQLEAEGLIRQIQSENSKTKRYQAEDDVEKIIKGVLRRREKPMMDMIQKSYLDLSSESATENKLHQDRILKMGLLIQMGQLGLATVLDTDEIFNLNS
jgi:DNA-binding transcriptional regulator GbsR (MarR family)